MGQACAAEISGPADSSQDFLTMSAGYRCTFRVPLLEVKDGGRLPPRSGEHCLGLHRANSCHYRIDCHDTSRTSRRWRR